MSLTTLTMDVLNSTAVTSSTTWALGIQSNELWIVITGFIVAFVLAFGIGANDVANSFATSVGAKVLTLMQACILATIFETAGAILIGAKVSDTIRKGIIDISLFEGQEALLMIGNVAALSGSCAWLLIATFFKMPVSGTHSIVGATVGYSLVQFAGRGIHWTSLILIVSSWFVSPILAGAVSVVIFALIRKFILEKEKPVEPGLMALPFIYALTVIINVFSVVFSGTPTLGFDKIPLWGCLVITFGSGLLVAILVRVVVVPRMRKNIEVKCIEEAEEAVTPTEETAILALERMNGTVGPDKLIGIAEELSEDVQKYQKIEGPTKSILAETQSDSKDKEIYGENGVPVQTCASPAESCDSEDLKPSSDITKDRTEVKILFTFLQILTAIFGSFAHGGNDVSNAVGPLIGLWLVGYNGTVDTKTSTPIWLLAYGGLGISIGLWVWGRRVMQTLGEDLTKITPSSGFCIEIGSALTVLVASNVGIPISTTHCKVGSVVCTGRFRSRENVQWKVFRNIIFAWLVTLPVSGFISAGVYAGLREIWRHQ